MRKKLTKFYLMLLLSTVWCGSIYGQELLEVKGVILDEKSNLPLPGATVMVKGTTKGTVTDFDGNYNLKAAADAVLRVSYIGYQSVEEAVGGRVEIDFKLQEDSEQLSEVVVVGFGEQKKATVTGAISSISTQELKQSPAANLAVTLAGRLPGLTSIQTSGEPGRDVTQLFIRGQGTINARSPIILVDGVERDLTYMDPNEVESVTILKDASSTAIFGVRGANGVILVTTKRGSSEIPEVNLSVESGVQSFTRVAKPVNAFEFATLRNLAQNNDGLGDAYSAEALEAYRTHSDPERYPDTDWAGLLMEDFAQQQRVNLNISGAGKAVKYYVNAGYLNQGGLFRTEKNLDYDPSFKLDRYNFRSNIDMQVNPGLKAFLNLAGYVEKQNSPFSVSTASTGQGGTSPSVNILAGILDIPSNVPGPTSPSGAVVTTPELPNPAYGLLNRTGYRQQTRNNITSTFGIEQKLDFITKGLSAKAVMSFDTRATNNLNANKNYVREVQVIEQTTTGKDTIYYRNFSDDVETPLNITGSRSFQSFSNFQAYLNYKRSFKKHDVSALVLYQHQKRIINEQLPYNLIGVSSRFTYGYNGKYFFEFNAGYNGSEQFAPGRRFGFFPAVSAGWLISKEKFWNVKGIDRLKIRGSYGEVGNDRIGNDRFLYLDDISVNGGGYSSSLNEGRRIAINQLKNGELQWEVAKKVNIGFEMGFLNAFDLIVDVFTENRDNILRNRGTIPILNGLPNGTLPPVNIGVVENKGFEVELNYKKAFSPDFFVRGRAFVGYATNKQKFADEPLLPEDYAYRYRQTGYRIGQNFGYVVEKYFETQEEIDNSPEQIVGGHESRPGDFKYKDLNGDGVVDQRDIAPIGASTVPETSFGLGLSTTYKNFDLSVLVQGVANVDKFYRGRGTYASGQNNFFSQHLSSWTPERAANGEHIGFPRLSTEPSPSEKENSFFIRDASYVRLKNLEIGYRVPLKGVANMRLYVNGLNLITWDKLPNKNYDPEAANGLTYPLIKVYSLGVNVKF
ncbi:SusC/RagA family TonB-linked outer membrane protein [Tamlana crocina]|uniref:TonB-dependent receptor n=1 Tax=Tamlana crocina TaxID=393006 RepID=A0ABX1D7V5_9FLAO|nr:TonB-dependent receptor [Tamlana crocina]NJX14447.1 TonB-dependent receptor [Tamlana crocina]